MSIDPVQGGAPPTVGGVSELGATGTQATSAAEGKSVGGPGALLQSLAAEVRQGSLSREDATLRFAADVVQRRFPSMSDALRQRAALEVGRALGDDAAFQRRFERLLNEAH